MEELRQALQDAAGQVVLARCARRRAERTGDQAWIAVARANERQARCRYWMVKWQIAVWGRCDSGQSVSGVQRLPGADRGD